MRLKVASLIFILAAGASCICGQEKSDREKADFHGYVKSVKEETAEVIFKNGKPTEGKKQLESVTTFDLSGKYLTQYVYTDDGKVLYGDTFRYDPTGKLSEKITEHSKFTYLCDKNTYSYNDAGQTLEETCFVNGQGAVGKYISRYDSQGRLLEKERIPIIIDRQYFSENTLDRYQYDTKGRLVKRSSFVKVGDDWKPDDVPLFEADVRSYSNDESRISTSLKYDASGVLKLVEVSLDDESGNELETLTYFPDGTVKSGNRYTYEFDKNGNAVRETDSEWTNQDGRTFFQLSEVTYRTIEYYSDREIAQFKVKQSKLPGKAEESNRPVSEAIDPEEYAIYKLLAKGWLEDSQIEHVVISRYTGFKTFAEDNGSAPSSIAGVEKEISDDFYSKNWKKTSELLPGPFGNTGKLVFISEAEQNEIFRNPDKGWEYFYKKYPKAQGITSVSRVGFNKAKTRAIVYFGTQSYSLAGAGFWVILEKEPGGWKITSRQMIWIS